MTDTPPAAAEARLALVEAAQRPALPGDPPLRLQVTAERTGHPNLVIAPAITSFGRFEGGFMLLQVPSGMSIRSGYPVEDLRVLARRLEHLDWAAVDADGAMPEEVRALAFEVLRVWQDERDGLVEVDR